MRKMMLILAFAAAFTLFGCDSADKDIATTQEGIATQQNADEVKEEAPTLPPPTVDSLFEQMRAHEKVEAFVTVTSKVSMTGDEATLKLPVSIDLSGEANIRGSVTDSHIEGKGGVSALVLNYDYPFETYIASEDEGLTLYMYRSDEKTWSRVSGISGDEVFAEGTSFLSLSDEMFEGATLSTAGEDYLVSASIPAERVSDMLFSRGMIDISALERLGFSLKDILFTVNIYFDKETREIKEMILECPEGTDIQGFRLESFRVDTKYIAFDEGVEDVSVPAEVREKAVTVR